MYLRRNNLARILSLYTKGYGREYFLREISRVSGLPLKTTQRALHELEELRILRARVRGKNKYFKLNLNNPATKFLLIDAEIIKTLNFIEAYPNVKPFIKELSSDTPIIVFGSFAKFNAGKDSDLDLVIFGEKVNLPYHLLPYKVHKIVLSSDIFTQKEPLIKEVEESHIILNNFCFYVQRMWRYYG